MPDTTNIGPSMYAMYVAQFCMDHEKAAIFKGFTHTKQMELRYIEMLKKNYPVGAERNVLDLALAVLVTEKNQCESPSLVKHMIDAVLIELRKQAGAARKSREPCLICGHVARRKVSEETVQRLKAQAILNRKRKTEVQDALRKMVDVAGDKFVVAETYEKWKPYASKPIIRRFFKKLFDAGEVVELKDGKVISVWIKTDKYGKVQESL